MGTSVPKVILEFQTVSGINTGNAVARWANPAATKVAHIKEYQVHFYYRTMNTRSDGKTWIWYDGGESTVSKTLRNAVYAIPSEAYEIKVSVKPIPNTYKAKVKKKNGETKEVTKKRFTGSSKWGFLTVKADNFTPAIPSPPSLSLKSDGTFRAEASGDEYTTQIEIMFKRPTQNGVTENTSTYPVNVDANKSAAAEHSPRYAGYTMVALARSINTTLGLYSGWSAPSDEKVSIPPAVPTPRAVIVDEDKGIMRVDVDWVYGIDVYKIQYTNRSGVWSGEGVSEVSIERGLRTIDISVQLGTQYWVRAKGSNRDNVDGPYGGATQVIVGKKPQPPTTWSDKVTVKIGMPVMLYWIHNTVDGSAQTLAQVELSANGNTQIFDVNPIIDSYTGQNSNKGEHKLDTSGFADQIVLRWRVRTRGISDKWSDWSTQREISLYTPPTLNINLYQSLDGQSLPVDTVVNFPFYIVAEASPLTQKAIGFYFSIVTKSAYDYVAVDGTNQTVGEGQEIYSEFFDFSSTDETVKFGDYATVSNNIISLKLTPDKLDLEPGIKYMINSSVSMNTGLDANASRDFSVEWDEELRYPKCELNYDPDNAQMSINPFCVDGLTADDEYIYSKDVTLSVYRREHNGELKLVASDVVNDGKTAVVDPHPSLKEAMYRIIAVSNKTGFVTYDDEPGYPIYETDIIIQWDETWQDVLFFENEEEFSDSGDQLDWSGSMLRLPYNIDTSESTSPDVALIKPIGRKRPVSHYGTQLSETATWNTEFPKSDTETIAMLRRLQAWQGDVYVREPSGTGYWANVTVSFNLTHLELTVPVTINVTRVEGGL